MRIYIKEKKVTLYEDSGDAVSMTLEQLLEIVRVLNATMNQDGAFIFESLDFTV